jgi:DNA ligase-1
MKFPKLYQISITGKIKTWSIRVIDSYGVGIIITNFAYEDSKLRETMRSVLVGKNIGKSNETTPVEQAEKEALSEWKKMYNNGYKPEEEEDVEMERTKIIPVEIRSSSRKITMLRQQFTY